MKERKKERKGWTGRDRNRREGEERKGQDRE